MTSKQAGSPTYRTLVDQATTELFNDSDSPRIDAEVLLQHVVQGSMAWLIANGDNFATAEHIRTFSKLVELRQQGQPIAYLVGHKEFWSLQLKVNEHVLVPRADTETLVEQSLNLIANIPSPRILDLGTGSGAIALALAKELPQAKVIAVDASIDALNIAEENAKSNQLNNVQCILSDWFAAVEGDKFDLITANPPYVAADDSHLNKGDLRFEPNVALVAKKDGFADLQTIISNAPLFLQGDAKLIVEHGYQQGPRVKGLFQQAGFAEVKPHYDLNNLPRCTSGSYPK